MTRLLYIKASPRGQDSRSAALADAYLARLRQAAPDLVVDTLDLALEKLPEFDGDSARAKMTVILGQEHDATQKTLWDEVSGIANRFIAADRYLFAVPMWNGGIPYRLKQYIDIIHQPRLLFGLDPAKGYFGLLKNKRAVLALTSGAYNPEVAGNAFGTDHHSTYLRAWLTQTGVETIDELRFQPTLLTADAEGDFRAAVSRAEALAAKG